MFNFLEKYGVTMSAVLVLLMFIPIQTIQAISFILLFCFGIPTCFICAANEEDKKSKN